MQGCAQGLVCLVETRLGIHPNQAGIVKPVITMPGIPIGIVSQRQCIPGVDQAGIWGCAQPWSVVGSWGTDREVGSLEIRGSREDEVRFCSN